MIIKGQILTRFCPFIIIFPFKTIVLIYFAYKAEQNVNIQLLIVTFLTKNKEIL
jgi:hypothetical protein